MLLPPRPRTTLLPLAPPQPVPYRAPYCPPMRRSIGWRNLVWEIGWRNLVWEARRRHGTRTATAAVVSVAAAVSVAISLRVGRTGTRVAGVKTFVKTLVPRCQANRRRSRHQSA